MTQEYKKVVLRTYKGNESFAFDYFRKDAENMASYGYVPTSQNWVPGSYGFRAFLLALLACFLIFGIFIFIYMILVKPSGNLNVTYELRSNPAHNTALPAKSFFVSETQQHRSIKPDNDYQTSDITSSISESIGAGLIVLCVMVLLVFLSTVIHSTTNKRSVIKNNNNNQNAESGSTPIMTPSNQQIVNVVVGRRYELKADLKPFYVPATNYTPANLKYDEYKLPKTAEIFLHSKNEYGGTSYYYITSTRIQQGNNNIEKGMSGWVRAGDIINNTALIELKYERSRSVSVNNTDRSSQYSSDSELGTSSRSTKNNKEIFLEAAAREAGVSKEYMRKSFNNELKEQGMWEWSQGGF